MTKQKKLGDKGDGEQIKKKERKKKPSLLSGTSDTFSDTFSGNLGTLFNLFALLGRLSTKKKKKKITLGLGSH